MRFVNYHDGLMPAWGVLVGEASVVDSRQLGNGLPSTLREFIPLSATRPGLLADVKASAAAATPARLDAVTLAPCVPQPGKIICLGVNYHDHAKEGGNAICVRG